MSAIAAVVFDLDGVLVQSEEIWDEARRELAAAHRVAWPEGATRAMMGMSSIEWSRYLHDEAGNVQPADPSWNLEGVQNNAVQRVVVMAGASRERQVPADTL